MLLKETDGWKLINAFYMKNNGTWTVVSKPLLRPFLETKVCNYGGYIQPVQTHSILIIGQTEIVGTGATLSAIYDNTTDVTTSATWSVVSGGTYASINQNGELSISSNANTSNITVKAVYGGTESTRQFIVTYHSEGSLDHTLSIMGASSITGETASFTAFYDGSADVSSAATWTIISGGTYATINNAGVVTILSNANGNSVTIKAEYENAVATKEITVKYRSGTNTETNVIVDESGGTTVSVITENSDGSSISTNTHYDENGNETGHETENTDTSGNTSTQTVVKDENGNDVVTGYEIDTSGNANGGMPVSGGVDTGVLVFDGHDWAATLKAKILFSNITSAQHPLMNVSSRGDDNKLDGAFFLVTRMTSSMGSSVYDENGTKQSITTSSNPTLKWRIQNYLGGSLQSGVDFYYKNGTRPYYTNRFGSKTTALTLTYKMVYTESNHQLVTEIYAADGTTILAKPRSEAVVTFTRTMSDITFEIGRATNVSGVELSTKLEVLDFHVEKTL